MFDIGSPEILTVAVIALLVLGPERLPEALRTMAQWWDRFQRSFARTRQQIEEEIGFDRIRQQLDEEGVMAEIKAVDIELNSLLNEAGSGLTELTGTRSDPRHPSHWPGMPPPD